jgi:hypothetical protein
MTVLNQHQKNNETINKYFGWCWLCKKHVDIQGSHDGVHANDLAKQIAADQMNRAKQIAADQMNSTN